MALLVVLQVVTVSPSLHETPITATANQAVVQAFDALGERGVQEWGPDFREPLRDAVDAGMGAILWDARRVDAVMLQAVSTRRPRAQYVVGLDARFLFLPLNMLPRRVLTAICRPLHPFPARTPAAVKDPSYYVRQRQQVSRAGGGGRTRTTSRVSW